MYNYGYDVYHNRHQKGELNYVYNKTYLEEAMKYLSKYKTIEECILRYGVQIPPYEIDENISQIFYAKHMFEKMTNSDGNIISEDEFDRLWSAIIKARTVCDLNLLSE